MFDLITTIGSIIGTETVQQSALSLVILGSFGLGMLALVIRLVTKIKAVAFFGG